MTIEILDPTHGDDTAEFALAERLSTIEGATIGIISNGKQGTRRFFDALADELTGRHGAAEVVRLTKNNYSAPADPTTLDRVQEWNALISGIGD